MARLAIFIDGGYTAALSRSHYQVRIDFEKFSQRIHETIANDTAEPLDLLRTHYYACLSYQGNPPTPDQKERVSRDRMFFDALAKLSKFTVREGRLVYRGLDAQGQPIYQQKGVDLLLGLDFALLAAKNRITHAAVVSGDSDLIPAFEVAKQEGINVWLVHGPAGSYASQLWSLADDRISLTQEFMASVARPSQAPLPSPQ